MTFLPVILSNSFSHLKRNYDNFKLSERLLMQHAHHAAIKTVNAMTCVIFNNEDYHLDSISKCYRFNFQGYLQVYFSLII